MANEIQFHHSTTSQTLYAMVFNGTSQVWNGSAFVDYDTANLNSYDIPMAELGTASAIYVANFPSGIANGAYSIFVKLRAGETPAESDQRLGVGEHIKGEPARYDIQLLAWNTGTLATAWLNILLTRLTDARAANLVNLDVAGLVASQADVGALAPSSAVGDIQTAVDAIKALTDLLSVTGDVLDQSYNALLVDPPPTTISPSSMFGLAGGSVANTLTLLDRFTALRAAYIDLLPGIDTDIDAILAGDRKSVV